MTTDPYASHPVPAKLPVDTYLGLNQHKQLQYAKEQLSSLETRRRIHLETGKLPSDKYQSTYEDMLKLVRDDGLTSEAYSNPNGVAQFGAVLKAARDNGDIEGTGKSAVSNWKTAVTLARVLGQMTAPVGVAGRNAATLANGKSDTTKQGQAKYKSVLTAAAGSRTAQLSEAAANAKARALKVKQRRDRFETAAEPVRKVLLRRSSFPGAVTNTRALTDDNARMKSGLKEMKQLQAMIEGQEPRAEEVSLTKRVVSLEAQVNNQIALIKGLREKVKVTTSERDALLVHCRTNAALGLDAPSVALETDSAEVSRTMSFRRMSLNPERTMAQFDHVPSPMGNQLSRVRSRLFGVASMANLKNTPNPVVKTPRATEAEVKAKTIAAKQQSFIINLMNPDYKVSSEHGVAPLADTATVVFVDVQSNGHLWETMPEIMKRESEVFINVVSAKRQMHEGYLVDRIGERMCLVFSGAYSAVRFALDVQTALCNAPWSPELCENPDTPTELVRGASNQFVWRGLRVCMGIANGAVAQFDPQSSTTMYTGQAMEVAALLQVMAVGGEVLVTGDAHGAASGLIAQGAAMAEQFGKLHRHTSRAMVYRFVAPHHSPRLHYFQRDLYVAESSALDALRDVRAMLPVAHSSKLTPIYHSPPSNTVAMMSVSPADLQELRGMSLLSDAALNGALQQFRRIVEALARSNRGHVGRQMDYHFNIAFQQPYDAVNMALRLQMQLLEAEWHEEILTVPKCSCVKIRDEMLFNGLRARVGIHIVDSAYPETDVLTGCSNYAAHREAQWASVAAATAFGGETLVSARVVDLVMKNVDRLRYPACASAVAVTVPNSDAIHTFHYLFPAALSQRASFFRREMKLPSEPSDDRTDAIDVAERSAAVLQAKLVEKDAIIKSLERQTLEKTAVIERMREDIIGRKFEGVDVRRELGALEAGAYYDPTVVMALSFAHAPILMEQWPDEFPPAIAILDEFVGTLLGSFNGIEIRRTQSGVMRILTFSDIPSALEFWLTLIRNVSLLPWPERLMQSEHAGIIMASDLVPGLHASLDTMLWKGLRPIAGIVRGLPDTALNPVTRTMVAAGGCVNDAVLLLRKAGDGELWMTDEFGTEAEVVTEDRLANATIEKIPDAGVRRVYPSELLQRHAETKKVIARLATENSLPVVLRSECNRVNAFVLHVTMQDSELFKDTQLFAEDLDRFRNVLMGLIAETSAHVISCSSTEWLLGFQKPEEGADVAMHIHTALMRQNWSQSLLRLPDCRPRWSKQGLCMAGIRAICGCHYLEDILVTVDLVEGSDVWVHRELAVPYILTKQAAFGQTMATKQALNHLEQLQRFTVYHEASGSIVMPTDTVPYLIYACLPSPIRDRVVLLTADHKTFASYASEEEWLKSDLRKTRRAMELAEATTRDRNAVGDMAAHQSGVHRPFDEVTTHAVTAARAKMVSAHRARVTAEDTMAILETVAMMAEDPMYLSEAQKAKHERPQHQALLFHHLEHAEVGKRAVFDRQFANDLIFKVAFGGGDEDDDEDDEAEDRDGDDGVKSDSKSDSVRRVSMKRGMSMKRGGGATVSSRGAKAGDPEGLGSAGHTIPVEDAIRIHVDIERFANLVLMFGIQPSKGAEANKELLEAWVDPLYDQVCPDFTRAQADREARLRGMARQTRALDVMEDAKTGVDPDELHRSVIANLSLSLQRLVFEAGQLGSVTSFHSPSPSL